MTPLRRQAAGLAGQVPLPGSQAGCSGIAGIGGAKCATVAAVGDAIANGGTDIFHDHDRPGGFALAAFVVGHFHQHIETALAVEGMAFGLVGSRTAAGGRRAVVPQDDAVGNGLGCAGRLAQIFQAEAVFVEAAVDRNRAEAGDGQAEYFNYAGSGALLPADGSDAGYGVFTGRTVAVAGFLEGGGVAVAKGPVPGCGCLAPHIEPEGNQFTYADIIGGKHGALCLPP